MKARRAPGRFEWFSRPVPVGMIPNVQTTELLWFNDLMRKKDSVEDVLQNQLGDVLGCGVFGCVMESSGPWVVKFSSDAQEGPVWAFIQRMQQEHPGKLNGFPRIKEVIRIFPDIRGALRATPLYAIIREAGDPVFRGKFDATGVRITERTQRELGISKRAIEEFAYDPLLWFPSVPLPEVLQDEMEDHHVLKRDRKMVAENVYGALDMMQTLKDYKNFLRNEVTRRWYVEEGFALQDESNLIADELPQVLAKMDQWIPSKDLGQSLAWFAEKGLAFNDIHFRNIGWRVRENIPGFPKAEVGVMVIDPGQPMGRDLTDVVSIRSVSIN